MSRLILIIELLVLTAGVSCGSEYSGSKDKVVLIISVGGLPASELRDPDISAPTLRRLISEGASAARMTSVDPTVSWPNHASLSTGVRPDKHGVLLNGLVFREGPRLPVRVKPCDRAEVLRARTIYDLAKESGLTTALVSWPPGQVGGTITWSFGELSNSKGPIEQEMTQAGTLNDTDLEEVGQTSSPRRDDIWLRAASHILSQHRPNLLLLRLTDFDAITHKGGLGKPESRSALAAADSRISQVVELLKKTELLERTTIVVVSDQGFKSARRHIRPNAALRKAGLLKVEGPKLAPKVASAEAYALTAGGIAQLFLTDPDKRKENRSRMKELFSTLEGVERAIEPSGYAASGFPERKDNEYMADLILIAKPGYGFIAAPDGEPVTDVAEGMTVAFHGYPSSDSDMDGVFIAWGASIRPGVHLEKIANVDVAPTVARILGLKMDNVDGRILSEILK